MTAELTSRELSPGWLADVGAWVDARLAARGAERTGALRRHKVRPWGVTLHCPTTGGRVWFKASGGATRYEPGLVELLSRLVPHGVVPPLDGDTARGWMLLADGGPTLCETGSVGGDRWTRIVAEHAELQRAVSGHVGEMDARGVPDGRPATLPGELARLLRAAPLDEHTRVRTQSLLPAFARACERLAAGPVPASVQHDDLHPGNVVAGPSGHGPARFFDWGDAVVAHPFGVLLVPISRLRRDGNPHDAEAAVRDVRDAYLEPWTADYPRGELLPLVDDAVWVARAGRALCYERALRDATAAQRREWGSGMAAWLRSLDTNARP